MPDQKLKLSISKEGRIAFIYDDRLADLLREGQASVCRVSNVEPTEDGMWQATMIDGTKLGKHKLRADALAEEVSYIERVLFSKGEYENTESPA